MLQSRDGPHPYALIDLDSLATQQAYDISLTLDVPRSPTNLAAGNFMASLLLLSPAYTPTTSVPKEIRVEMSSSAIQDAILYSARRPAILTYHDPLVSLTHRLLALPFYALGLKRENEVLTVGLGEAVEVGRGWQNVPRRAWLQLQMPPSTYAATGAVQSSTSTAKPLEVYSSTLKFRARFSGLRWLMYNYRILAFAVFTSAFWGFEMAFALGTWALLSVYFSGRGGGKKAKKETGDGETNGVGNIKAEGENEAETDEPDLSDTPRNFPTYGRQTPLRYEARVKREGTEETERVLAETGVAPLDADDESEEVGGRWSGENRGGRSDSGIGTSFSEAGGSGSGIGVYRRRSGRR